MDYEKKIEQAIGCVCEAFGVKSDVLVSRSRTRKVADARMVLATVLSKHGIPVLDIAKAINRNRTTVLYSVQTIPFYVKGNADLRRKMQAVEEALEVKDVTAELAEKVYAAIDFDEEGYQCVSVETEFPRGGIINSVGVDVSINLTEHSEAGDYYQPPSTWYTGSARIESVDVGAWTDCDNNECEPNITLDCDALEREIEYMMN